MWVYVMWAVLAGGLLPTTLLLARSSIRKERLKAVDELTDLLYGPADGNGRRRSGRGDSPAREILPQLEFVRTKYDPDTYAVANERSLWFEQGRSFPKAALYVSALIFGAVSAIGFWFLFSPVCIPTFCPAGISAFLIWPPTPVEPAVTQSMIAGAAFVGAFFSAAVYLSRRVLNFELHTLAFSRAIIGILLGVLIALIAYKALNGGADFVLGLASLETPPATPGLWLGIAFALGASPEFGLTWLARGLKVRFRKEIDDRATARALIIPIEVIDGIDSEIAFRLQESGIEDVQNLATYNPLQLYVESPYGLLQCFDWVLQAQLCVVCGRDAFFALKDSRIRTAFDLERAVLARGVDDAYVVALGLVIFHPGPLKAILNADTPSLAAKAAIVRHGVAVMTDDLHVHRLRSLWTRIRDQLSGGEPEWLYLTVPLPGEEGFPPAGATDVVPERRRSAERRKVQPSGRTNSGTAPGGSSGTGPGSPP